MYLAAIPLTRILQAESRQTAREVTVELVVIAPSGADSEALAFAARHKER